MFFKYCGFWIFFEEKPASSTKSTKHLKLFDPLLSTAPAAKVRWFSPQSPHRQGGNDSSGVSATENRAENSPPPFEITVTCLFGVRYTRYCHRCATDLMLMFSELVHMLNDTQLMGCGGGVPGGGGSQRSVNLHDMLNVMHNRWGWDGGEWGGKGRMLMLTSLELVKQSYSQKRFRVRTKMHSRLEERNGPRK